MNGNRGRANGGRREHGRRRAVARMAMIVCSAIALCRASTIAAEVDFLKDVQPILARRRARCHRADHAKGDVRLDTSDDLMDNGYVVPGSPHDSMLIDLVSAVDNQRPQMPKDGDPLSAEDVAILTRWVRQGAPWPADVIVSPAAQADATWWSLQPLVRTQPPRDSRAPRNGIRIPSTDSSSHSSNSKASLRLLPPTDGPSFAGRPTI